MRCLHTPHTYNTCTHRLSEPQAYACVCPHAHRLDASSKYNTDMDRLQTSTAHTAYTQHQHRAMRPLANTTYIDPARTPPTLTPKYHACVCYLQRPSAQTHTRHLQAPPSSNTDKLIGQTPPTYTKEQTPPTHTKPIRRLRAPVAYPIEKHCIHTHDLYTPPTYTTYENRLRQPPKHTAHLDRPINRPAVTS